jgi:hypothetical protein
VAQPSDTAGIIVLLASDNTRIITVAAWIAGFESACRGRF